MIDPLHAVAHPTRRAILRRVWDAEAAAGEIAAGFDVSFAAVSQHLGVLRDAGLVTVRPDGRRRLYRAARDAMGPLAATLEAMWVDRLGRLREVAEELEREETR